jgi:hypothetical protein
MCRILDDWNARRLSEASYWIHLACLPREMDRHNRLHPPGTHGASNLFRIDVARIRIDIRKEYVGAEIPHHLRGCRKRIRRSHDGVTGTDTYGFKSEMQTGGGGVHTDSFHAATDKFRKLALERACPRSGSDPAGAQAVHDLRNFLLADVRKRERQKILTRVT